MSSIVAEVLQSTGNLAKENILLKVADLKRKLEVIKLEVFESLNQNHEEFYPLCSKLDNLLEQLKQVTADYDDLHHQIEKEIKPQMVNSVAEFHGVLEDLQKIKILKSVVWSIVELHQSLDAAKQCKSQNVYFSAAEQLEKFQSVFKKIDSNYKKNIIIINALQAEFRVTKEKLIFDLVNFWKQNIVISNNVMGKNKKNITLSMKEEDSERCGEILKALYLLKNLRPMLKEFGHQFLLPVCEVIISNNVKINVTEHSVLTVDILNEQSSEPSRVFESLRKILDFVNNELFMLPLDGATGDVEVKAMNELGSVISDDFCTLIIEKCLKSAVPKQSKHLDAFHKEMTAAQNFCNFIVNIEFCSKSNNPLLDFIRNIDLLPVTIMAQDILSRARMIMKKCLHQTVYVGVESLLPVTCDSSHPFSEIGKTKNGLSKSTFSFPRCQISVSTKELVKLFLEVKKEAKDIGPNHAPRLFYVTRSICELYCCSVPKFHKEEIQNIPQQTAIFHNNCMYLAYKLCYLGSLFECEIMADIPTTFADIIPEIKKLGVEAFLSQMRHQKRQLLQLIQDQQAYQNIMIDEGLINKAEKSVRQCLCQLKLLQKVWSDVLPSEVYFKAVGTLFNTCLEEIILRVLSIEDISADAAAQMDSMFAILLKQGPGLFKIQQIDKSNSVHLYVTKWFKFQELQLILSANLREIVDRWSNSKGPLSVHFSSDEVKHLIRALFQNTERRAAALAKIR